MRRALVGLLATALLVVAVAVATAGGSSAQSRSDYQVHLDNAFGLTKQADFRVAGVKVGSVSALDVDPATAQAVAKIKVTKPAFGGLRADASCEVRPQSLIGEYFLDCQPGTSSRPLAGGVVPIGRTAGTIPPDLVMSVLNKPYREKLTILLDELGAGFAARGGDVNATIRSAIPALRETDGVLRILSDERTTLQQLTRNASVVLGNLDTNRDQVERFVTTAHTISAISASRKQNIAATIHRLPAFEQQLRPTLQQLGAAARAQTPALRNLRIAAPQLTSLANSLGPFASASTPAIRALGNTSKTGLTAIGKIRPTVRILRRLATTAKQPITNLRFVLEQLDDRSHAVEPNAQSPTGAGFTGLEAFMRYFFVQSQAINIFDDRGYDLKLGLLVNQCTGYTDGADALDNPTRTKACSAALGPGGKVERATAAATTTTARRAKKPAASKPATATPAPAPSSTTTSTTTTPAPATPAAPSVPGVKIPGLPDHIDVPGVGSVPIPVGGGTGTGTTGSDDTQAGDDVLDFLLGS